MRWRSPSSWCNSSLLPTPPRPGTRTSAARELLFRGVEQMSDELEQQPEVRAA